MNDIPAAGRGIPLCLALVVALGVLPMAGALATPEFAEPDTCGLCHQDVADAQLATLHGAILERRAEHAQGRNCQTCHGPSQVHVEDPIEVKPPWTPDSLKRNTSARMCLTCHSNQISAMEWRKGDHHTGNVQCWECHSKADPPKAHSDFEARPGSDVCMSCHHEVKSAFRLNSHHPVVLEHEKRVECADCHEPHGRINTRDVNDICRSCHLAQRGPYRFTHGAISGRMMESCIECHQPHGSSNPDLLRFNSRGLCLQCHGDKVAHFPGPRCWDCHTAVHGSNSHPYLLSK